MSSVGAVSAFNLESIFWITFIKRRDVMSTQSRMVRCVQMCCKQLFVLSIALSIGVGVACAADPGQESWVSFRNGLSNPGIAASPLPADLELLWEFETPDGTASTPVIANGRAYVGTLSGEIHCFELATGKKVWTYRSQENVPENDIAPGFNAALAIDETGVYVGDDFGGFHAVERDSGKRRWHFETDGEIVGGAQIVGSKVIFGSHSGFLYALDRETGDVLWQAETFGPVNATPTIAGKYTFTTGCDQPILRVFEIDGGTTVKEVPLNSLLIAAAAARDNVLYFGTDGGSVYALDWEASRQVWEFSVPNRDQQIHSSPAVTEDVIVIGSRDKHVHCLDRKSGEPRWSFATRAAVDSSPVIAGDVVYFGSKDRNVYGVSLSDGKEVWKYAARQSITGSPAIADGYLVIGTDSSNGKILCFGKPR